jgi:hypothetical protein
LFAPPKLAAGLTAFSLAIGLCSTTLPGFASPVVLQISAPQETETIHPAPGEVITFEKPLMAHHGGEGSSAAAAGTAASGSQVLAIQGHMTHTATSDSLWGNLLLSMAYQRDPIIQKYAKRLGRVNTLTFLSVAGISGLGLAQSISALNNTHGSQSIDVTEAHHAGEHDHVHLEGDSKTPATLGIIGSSATLATLGLKAIFDRHYSHRLSERQGVIKGQIETILTQLKGGQPFETVSPQLTQLVGPIATEEFSVLWRSAYGKP